MVRVGLGRGWGGCRAPGGGACGDVLLWRSFPLEPADRLAVNFACEWLPLSATYLGIFVCDFSGGGGGKVGLGAFGGLVVSRSWKKRPGVGGWPPRWDCLADWGL